MIENSCTTKVIFIWRRLPVDPLCNKTTRIFAAYPLAALVHNKKGSPGNKKEWKEFTGERKTDQHGVQLWHKQEDEDQKQLNNDSIPHHHVIEYAMGEDRREAGLAHPHMEHLRHDKNPPVSTTGLLHEVHLLATIQIIAIGGRRILKLAPRGAAEIKVV